MITKHRVVKTRSRRPSIGVILWVVGLTFLLTESAWAIPSPDVVVNVFSGLAQGLVVLGTMVASFAVSLLRRLRGDRHSLKNACLLTLLLALITSVGFNVVQSHRADAKQHERLTRNLLRKSTQNGKTVRDVNLKELSKSSQLTHPQGLSTERVHELSRVGRLQVLDVREPEEFEMGWFPGATQVRYPDLRNAPSMILKRDKSYVLLCYSGNRSGELAEELHKEGYDCSFMIGGYEKWCREDGRLEGTVAKEAPRDIRGYQNKDILLDTAEVEELYRQGNVTFIDARYPAEFEAERLPNAINFPLRMMSSAEVQQRLSEIPSDRVLIGVGYDKRSSFYSKILGSKLSKRGHEWAGRYTVPSEFIVPKTETASEQATALARLTDSALGWLVSWTDSVGLAILLLVLMLRVAIAPLTLRAEASSRAEKRLEAKIEALKEETKDDSARFRRERMLLWKEGGVRPMWSLTSGLVQASVFVFLATVLATSSWLGGASLGWIPSLSAPDSLLILPIVLSVLAGVQMSMSGKFRGTRGLILIAVLTVVFFFLTKSLMAGINLAICANLGVSVLHSWTFKRFDARRAFAPKEIEKQPCQKIVSLGEAHGFKGVGPKAERLSLLMDAGLPVPNGFVLPHGYLHERDVVSEDADNLLGHLSALGANLVAVRSSALDEDGDAQSFAGIFDSKLDVTRESFLDAVEDVVGSFRSDRARAYHGDDDAGACVLVQRMLDPDYAGVLFTRHPRYRSEMAVEYVEGCGEKLVSGSAQPVSLTVGRMSGRVIEGHDQEVPFPLEQLLKLARRCEKYFGKPQDIEWAVVGDKVYILQSRDITAGSTVEGSAQDRIEIERARLIECLTDSRDSNPPLAREGFAELAPNPTPSSISLIERLLSSGAAVDSSRRAFGLPYAPEHASSSLQTVFGRLFVDRRSMERLFPRRRGLKKLAGIRFSMQCQKARRKVAQKWRETHQPRIESEVRVEKCRRLSELSLADLGWVLNDRVSNFTQRHYRWVEDINVCAAYQEALAQGAANKLGENLATMRPTGGRSITAQGEDLLREVAIGKRPLSDYVEEFGHRASVDYELSAPRFSEDASLLEPMMKALADEDVFEESTEVVSSKTSNPDIDLFFELSALKETARHHAMKSLALVRDALLAIGRRSGLDDLVFYLSLEEVEELTRNDEAILPLTHVAEHRKLDARAYASFDAVDSHSELGLHELEGLGRRQIEHSDQLHGACVSGDQTVGGRVRVVLPNDPTPVLKAGEILVAPYTDTSLAPLFRRAGGLVTEIGGMLSHAAIVAREYRLTALVGVAGATRNLQTGDHVRLHPDGSVELVERNRRTFERSSVSHPVQVQTGDGEVQSGTTIDQSSSGVRVSGVSGLRERQEVTLVINGYPPVAAKVRRVINGDQIGFAFPEPMRFNPSTHEAEAMHAPESRSADLVG